MRTAFFRIVFAAGVLFCSSVSPAVSRLTEIAEGHLTDLAATITLTDGSNRTARVEGVGCTESVCSRIAIKGRDAGGALVKIWLDSIQAIQETTPAEGVFVLKNGTEKRLSFEKDFRVLYLATQVGGPERVDIAKVRSVEFSGVK